MIIPNLKCGKDERQPPKKRAKACLTLTVDAESQKSWRNEGAVKRERHS